MIETYVLWVNSAGGPTVDLRKQYDIDLVPIEELVRVLKIRPKDELFFIGSKTFVDEKQAVLFRMQHSNLRLWLKDRLEDYGCQATISTACRTQSERDAKG